MQTYDCHACYVRGNEVDELTKNFKEAYGLLLVRNNVLSAENKIANLRITELEKDIPWFFDRIAELEQENIEFIDVNIYEHSVAEKARATIKRVTFVRDELATQTLNGHAVKMLDKALGEAK